ncbi:MAG: hypothetical protein KAW47_06330 [Thermoplasmatales archaeon]|nr:hypothetical protein [Thermoplasmatales archaeon]
MQTLNINQKIAKISFILLYGILAFFIIFSFLRTYLYQKDWSAFQAGQPIDYALAGFFSNLFGTEYNAYFLFAIPFMLLLVYGAIRLGGWLVRRMDKRTSINGENHIAMIILILLLPNFIYLMSWFFFRVILSTRALLLFGVFLVIIYIVITEIDDKKKKSELNI